jgi:hypothetical protein
MGTAAKRMVHNANQDNYEGRASKKAFMRHPEVWTAGELASSVRVAGAWTVQ